MTENIKFPIDFVVSWVDQNDLGWQQKKNKFLSISDKRYDPEMTSDVRYRDYGIFKYWFRSVELFAPWVHKIYVVTDHQVPEFLNTKSEKVQLIYHDEFIPNKYLPTFNSSVIEMFLDKIPGISDHFVYFNDDFFINSSVDKSFFFSISGAPKDSAIMIPMQPTSDFEHIPLNTIKLINQHFDKKNVQTKYFSKFFSLKYGLKYNLETLLMLPFKKFSMFQFQHTAYSLRKSDYSNLDNLFPNIRNDNALNKFRSNSDINIWILQAMNYVNGDFSPRSTHSSIYLTVDHLKEIHKALHNKKYKIIIVNDTELDDFSENSEKLKILFDLKFKRKSKYEW